MTRMVAFGDPNLPIDLEFPTQSDLANFPLNKRIKLCQIRRNDDTFLGALQLKFSGAVESPYLMKS